MYISERIDGGGILSHYFPQIEQNDNGASLFMKGIKGSVKLYTQYIEYIDKHDLPEGVIQERTFRYVRNIDWNILNDIKLRRFTKNGIKNIYFRKEKVIDYFILKKNDISKVYSLSLDVILKKR